MDKSQVLNAAFLNRERLSADMGNLLVLAPHPDDESLGCGGLIALLRESGNSVTVIFVTSGSASHTSRTHPPSVLSKMRELEATRACSALGVPITDLHFLRAPDSRLGDLQGPELSILVGEIRGVYEKGNFSAIALPWRRDPHPDHRVVNTIGEMFLKNLPHDLIKFEYPIWLWKNGTESDWPLNWETVPYKLDIAPVFEKKWRAVKMHRTQLGGIIDDDPNGFVLSEELLEPFNTDTEYFFVTRKVVETLDGGYFDALYSRQNDPWNFRNSEYELLKYRRSIRALGRRRFSSGLELGCSVGIQTEMLSKICENLTAVDINEIAVREAYKNCSGISNITFKVMDVVKEFPNGKFDLVTFCEMGYYMAKNDLAELFLNISNALLPGGSLLMVHWTPFVPDYPLSGDDVHNGFFEFATKTGLFKEMSRERRELYRLQVWQKV